MIKEPLNKIFVISIIFFTVFFIQASGQIEEPRCPIGEEMVYGTCQPKFTKDAVDKLFNELWLGFYHNDEKYVGYLQYENYESELALENIETTKEKFSFAFNELERIYWDYKGKSWSDESDQGALSQFRFDLDKVKEEIQNGFDLLDAANRAEAEWRVEKVQLELEKTQQEKEALEKEMSQLQTQIEEKETQQQGGCLIATATYGSELAPQVQMLREIRDNSLLQTQSGQSFMQGFNSFYYSFSPAIADLERQNPVFKEAVKLAITPLITSLSILNYVEIDSEAEMLSYGISLIMLNVGMYFVAPVMVIHRIKKILNS